MAEKMYHCTEAQHNKRWSYEIQGNSVIVKWGRVGLDGQSKTHNFNSSYERDSFISDKVAEKMKKGYKEVTQEKLEDEIKTAQDLGTQYKISRMEWVDKKGSKLSIISNYDPTRWIYVEILNSWSKEVVRLVFNKTESFQASGGIMESNRVITCDGLTTSYSGFVDAVRRYLKRLYAKVQQIVTTKFAAVGVRKIDFGGDEDEDVPDVPQQELFELVGDSGASTQVISKFGAMGKRFLDI